jgi:hypothetical protein
MRQHVAIIVLALLPLLGGCQTDVIVGQRAPDACALDADVDAPDACVVDADVDTDAPDADGTLADSDALDADVGSDL